MLLFIQTYKLAKAITFIEYFFISLKNKKNKKRKFYTFYYNATLLIFNILAKQIRQ